MILNRKIPTVMFSQHPDNAGTPYWHDKPFVNTHSEIKEALHMFGEMGAQEIMWDWEGKFVDDSVVEKLVGQNPTLFLDKPIGRDLFITFRIPNPRIESGYRLGKALTTIAAASHFTNSVGITTRPLFEVILPMTETAQEMFSIKTKYEMLNGVFDRSLVLSNADDRSIDLIPLFESVETILNAGNILREYHKLTNFHYIRPFCARSDPALNSGIVPTTLAIKWALSEFARFTAETGIPTFPIIAPGSLPFRGGLTPDTVKEFLTEFAGVKTIVIQSAFRYDFSQCRFSEAIADICSSLPQYNTKILGEKMYDEIKSIIPWFEDPYRSGLEEITPFISKLSSMVPKRRERFSHTGLTGYSRKVGAENLPRAIGFTGCCYSLGIPPELIGTGRGLCKAKLEGKLEFVESLYSQLKPALREAGRYLRKKSITDFGLTEIAEDIKFIEEYLGEKLGPVTESELKHKVVSGKIVVAIKKGIRCEALMEKAALLRKAIG